MGRWKVYFSVVHGLTLHQRALSAGDLVRLNGSLLLVICYIFHNLLVSVPFKSEKPSAIRHADSVVRQWTHRPIMTSRLGKILGPSSEIPQCKSCLRISSEKCILWFIRGVVVPENNSFQFLMLHILLGVRILYGGLSNPISCRTSLN